MLVNLRKLKKTDELRIKVSIKGNDVTLKIE